MRVSDLSLNKLDSTVANVNVEKALVEVDRVNGIAKVQKTRATMCAITATKLVIGKFGSL